MQPLGMKGTKKVQDILVDAKIPKERRDNVPIIGDDMGILWIVGIAMSERGRVTAQTREMVRITFRPWENAFDR